MAMRAFTLEEVATITRGRVLAGSAGCVSGLSLDSRTAEPGRLFAALKGERADGHDHCRQAAERGAAAVLVERPVQLPDGTGVVQVASVERAVRALAAEARSRFRGEVVGIVGSCGKTTTKDFTAAVLSALGPTYATPGNRNNLLGVPESLMAADVDARFWVLELGISQPGEMEELAPIARPTAVVFTTIQPVHTQFFPSLEAILEEKAKVMRWTEEGGRVLLNADDPLLAGLVLTPTLKKTTYGTAEGAELRIEALGTAHPEGIPFSLCHGGREARGFLPLSGMHNLLNFAAACAAGASYGAAVERMAEAAQGLRPARHRGERIHLKGDVFLLDESYNANPAAMESVLRSLEAWGERRPVAALGEMLELGPAWLEHHKRVGQLAAEVGVTVLLAVGGEGARAMAEAFRGRGREVLHEPRWLDGAEWLEEKLKDGDGLVVKGSRGVGLDGLVAWLRARRGA
jgi:UDP-N-acetylmuramoyl-tripeptide--D-alanyl-D-alanine ligase